jgi:hypothetical protein
MIAIGVIKINTDIMAYRGREAERCRDLGKKIREAKKFGGCQKTRNFQNFRLNLNKFNFFKKKIVRNSLKMSYIHETQELYIR